jgi:CTP synthase (UTP-ammonia lyase)
VNGKVQSRHAAGGARKPEKNGRPGQRLGGKLTALSGTKIMQTRIAVVGEYDPSNSTHQATTRSLENAARGARCDLSLNWLSTEGINLSDLREYDGLLIAPGSPYKDLGTAVATIQWARETKLPLLGTCGGFQHIILEFARNVLGIEDAAHAEYDPSGSHLFISKLACSLVGKALEVNLVPGSLAASLYRAESVIEQYYCNFGINPDYADELQAHDLKVSGLDSDHEIRIVELVDHPFFIGTLFVPQMRSTLEQIHPILTGFVQAARSMALQTARQG